MQAADSVASVVILTTQMFLSSSCALYGERSNRNDPDVILFCGANPSVGASFRRRVLVYLESHRLVCGRLSKGWREIHTRTELRYSLFPRSSYSTFAAHVADNRRSFTIWQDLTTADFDSSPSDAAIARPGEQCFGGWLLYRHDYRNQ